MSQKLEQDEAYLIRRIGILEENIRDLRERNDEISRRQSMMLIGTLILGFVLTGEIAANLLQNSNGRNSITVHCDRESDIGHTCEALKLYNDAANLTREYASLYYTPSLIDIITFDRNSWELKSVVFNPNPLNSENQLDRLIIYTDGTHEYLSDRFYDNYIYTMQNNPDQEFIYYSDETIEIPN